MNKEVCGRAAIIPIVMFGIMITFLLIGSTNSALGSGLLVCALVLSSALNLQLLVFLQLRRGIDKAPWCGVLFLLYIIVFFPLSATSEHIADWLTKLFFMFSMWLNVEIILYELRQRRSTLNA